MTRWLFDLGRHTDVCFIQCARTPADPLCRSELEAISARLPGIRAALVCERPNPYGAWTGYSGRIDQPMLVLLCVDDVVYNGGITNDGVSDGWMPACCHGRSGAWCWIVDKGSPLFRFCCK